MRDNSYFVFRISYFVFRISYFVIAVGLLLLGATAYSQDTFSSTSAPSPTPNSTVPRLIRYSGILQDTTGKPVDGVQDLTFSLYANESGGEPLWYETQTVELDAAGRYAVLLGAMHPDGLPASLFTSGEARWLGVQVGKFPEQLRVLLVSVPYALKAGDATTLGGKPASAYALAAQEQTDSGRAATTIVNAVSTRDPRGKQATLTTTTGASPALLTGTQNYIPVFTDNSGSLGNSVMYQNGGLIGMGTTVPGFPLHVYSPGLSDIRSEAGSYAKLSWKVDNGGSNQKAWQVYADAGANALLLGALNDAENNQTIALRVQRGTETGITSVNFPNGRVGVGTTSPGFPLHVYSPAITDIRSEGAAYAKYSWKVDNGWGDQKVWQFYADAGANALSLGALNDAENSDTVALRIQRGVGTGIASVSFPSGSVGIGTTTPTANLEVNGTTKFDSTVTFAAGQVFTGNGSGLINLNPANLTSGTAGINITGNAATATSATTAASATNAATATNATNLNGVPGTSYARLDTANSFTSNQTINANVGIGTSAGSRRLYVVSPASNLAAAKAVGVTASNIGSLIGESRQGVWGDSASGVGLYGTSDSSNGVAGITNHTGDGAAGAFINNQPYGKGLEAGSFGAGCTIWGYGTISCTGGKGAEVQLSDKRKIRLYAIESPQVWFEDFGTGSLEQGVAVIQLDPVFADIVNPDMAYHVFLTPKGDCEGLYVAAQAAAGFEVRELKGGKSNVPFDYRVVALRKGWEDIRLEDVTDRAYNPGRVGTQAATSGP
ncbi:MAG: hypothetical protein ACE145_18450 [Terriglobia bacterium]